MITAHKFIQQYRVARLIMIVIIVGLTIFLYTSYYANQTIQRLPSAQRLQMSSLISVSAALDDIDPFIQKNTVIGSSLADQNLVANENNNGGESIGTNDDNSNAAAAQSSNDPRTQQQNIVGNNISELSNSLNENNNENENENSNDSKNTRINIDKSDSNKIMQQNSAGECIGRSGRTTPVYFESNGKLISFFFFLFSFLHIDGSNTSYAQQQYVELPSPSSSIDLAESAVRTAAAAAAAMLNPKIKTNSK